MSTNGMIAQVQSIPTLIRDEMEAIDHRVRRLLDHNEILSTKRIITTGCGDSYMASLATELAFEQVAGIPTEPMTAMQCARYGVSYQPTSFPKNPLTIAISVSGTVARTREAMAIARESGALTVAITASPEAPLAQTAEKMLHCGVPEADFSPGVRSYRVSQMALFLIAIRFAEIYERLTQDEANAMRAELKKTADAIEATAEAVNDKCRKLAEAVAEHKNFVFTGDGPNYPTALFGAAKILESAGRHAIGQESEEWAHLQYFINVDTDTPTFVISPGGRGHVRVGELMESVNRVGRTSIAIVPEGDTVVGPQADWVLPVVGEVSELFSPMVYPVATELFAAHLSDVVGEPFFRNFADEYDVDNKPGFQTIRNSQVVGRDDLL